VRQCVRLLQQAPVIIVAIAQVFVFGNLLAEAL
jgi:hypothetical protein